MVKKNGYIIPGFIVFLLFSLLILFIYTAKVPVHDIPFVFLLIPVLFLITFINTDLALIILLISMIFSPEIKLFNVPQRAVVVRVDDFLLIVVFFSWWAKMAINKELGLLKRTPLTPVIIAYIIACVFSTGLGVIDGIVKPVKSFFYILKYMEYFMLYFMVVNSIRDKEQIKTFLSVAMVTCAMVCVYALATAGATGRATGPFEGSQGEPNTLGGYLVFLFPIAAGIFLYKPEGGISKISYAGLLLLIFITILATLSRGSYLAFIFMYLALIIFTTRKRFFLIGTIMAALLILLLFTPKNVNNRIKETFAAGKTYRPLGREITLDEAAAARIDNWQKVFTKWQNRPIFGYGITGVGLVDIQYPRILGETGIVGFFIFIWLVLIILRSSLYSFTHSNDDWMKGLILGFIAGFIGLLFHSFSAETFIIVRIMEPFWFFTAVVMVMPAVLPSE